MAVEQFAPYILHSNEYHPTDSGRAKFATFSAATADLVPSHPRSAAAGMQVHVYPHHQLQEHPTPYSKHHEGPSRTIQY